MHYGVPLVEHIMNKIEVQAILNPNPDRAPLGGDLRPVGGRHPAECLRAFLATEPNDVVGPIHPKAMPVILSYPEECDIWLSATWMKPASCTTIEWRSEDRIRTSVWW